MGGPGICSDFVFPPTGVAAGLLIHFEQDEIGEAALAQTPGGAQASDPTANDDNRNFFDALWRGERGVVAEEMAHLERIVDESSLDSFFTLKGETNEGRAAETEKLAAAQLQ